MKKYLEEIKKTKYKLYVDLDGVLVDFERAKAEFKGNKDDIWQNEDYWTNMFWMSDGKKLWDTIKKFSPIVLSSPGRKTNYEVMKGKDKWVDRELGKNQKRIFEIDKAKYANESSILIDDKQDNIDEWESEGGIGILHKNTNDTINKLKKIIGE